MSIFGTARQEMTIFDGKVSAKTAKQLEEVGSDLLEALDCVQWGDGGRCPYCNGEHIPDEDERDPEEFYDPDEFGHTDTCIVGAAIKKSKETS